MLGAVAGAGEGEGEGEGEGVGVGVGVGMGVYQDVEKLASKLKNKDTPIVVYCR